MKDARFEYEVLRPWAEIDELPPKGISPRVTDLANKTIGLFDNSKIAARGILTAIQDRLQAKFPTAKFSWYTAGNYYHGQPHYREKKHQEWKARFQEWVRSVDTVILAVAD